MSDKEILDKYVELDTLNSTYDEKIYAETSSL